MDNCPYCGGIIRYDVLEAFDRFTKVSAFVCPHCGNRMFIRLRWVLGNSLCGLKAETIGHYARYIVAQEIGFQPTAAEMGLGLAAAEGETEEAKHE